MLSELVVKEIYIDAPPQVVYEFLTDPVKVLRWMGVAAELDPRPGGLYRLDPNGRDVIRGKYLEVVPNSRVVFSWGYEAVGHSVPPGSTLVEISLEACARGTQLRLIHRNLPLEARDKHEFGWGHYLTRLRTVAEGGDPGHDPFSESSVRHG